MFTFKSFLTEESAFSKIRKRPYRILGQFKPSSDELALPEIEKEYHQFLRDKTRYAPVVPNDGVAHWPMDNYRISMHVADQRRISGNHKAEYHKDLAGEKSRLLSIWSNTKPTKIRAEKVDRSKNYYHPKKTPGKLVGGEIKAGDAVLIYDNKAFHSAPHNINLSDNRNTIVTQVIKQKKKKLPHISGLQ